MNHGRRDDSWRSPKQQLIRATGEPAKSVYRASYRDGCLPIKSERLPIKSECPKLERDYNCQISHPESSILIHS